MEEFNLEAIEVTRQVVEAASGKQAQNLVVLDTRQISSFADYFVICNGDSDRQIEAILKEVSSHLKKFGLIAHHSEGDADSGWVLLDLGSVIVHIFSPQQRDYYKLDELWSDGIPIIRIQ